MGETPLSKITKYRQYDAVSTLLEKGADVTISDKEGNTPLHNVVNNLYRVDIETSLQTIKILLAKDKWSQSQHKNNHNKTALDTESKNQLINQKNNQGETALFLAAQNRQQDVVSILIQNGADITIPDMYGDTPIHCAASSEQLEVLMILLRAVPGSPLINQQNSMGETPLSKITKYRQYKAVNTLLEKGADVTISDKDGNTPLHNVVINIYRVDIEISLQTIKILLAKDKWSQSQHKNNHNKTALDIAVNQNRYKIVNYFLNNTLIDVSETTVLFKKLFKYLFKTNKMFDAKKEMISSFRRHGTEISEDQFERLTKHNLIEDLQVHSLQNISRQVIKKYTGDNDIIQLPLPEILKLSLKDQ